MSADDVGLWRPTANWHNLRARARILAEVRAFFAARGILEVETPLLAAATVTEPHLSSLRSVYTGPGAPEGKTLYLQTSPEYAMKRLLASGSGPIYQIAKAFRNGEAGRLHNPEFTLLEWYRPDFTHHDLMDEMDAFLKEILGAPPAERVSYREIFEREAGLDPHTATLERLKECAREQGLSEASGLDRDGWLSLLMVQKLEPRLGAGRPTFIYDFPESQAALARVRPGSPPVAERFEVYVAGIELANGFHELSDAEEQRRRFESDRQRRRARSLEDVQLDERLLAALAQGLPHCAGVALGVDRLVMLATGGAAIDEVICFPLERA